MSIIPAVTGTWKMRAEAVDRYSSEIHRPNGPATQQGTANEATPDLAYSAYLAATGLPAGAPFNPVTSYVTTDQNGNSIGGAVAGLVGNEGGVVSEVINLESSGVEAPDRRPRHDEDYHEA
jgi:hypothetical protein